MIVAFHGNRCGSNADTFATWIEDYVRCPWFPAETRRRRGAFLIDLARSPIPNRALIGLLVSWGWCSEGFSACRWAASTDLPALEQVRDGFGLSDADKVQFLSAVRLEGILHDAGICRQVELSVRNRLNRALPLTAADFEEHFCEPAPRFFFCRALALMLAADHLATTPVPLELLDPARLTPAAEAGTC